MEKTENNSLKKNCGNCKFWGDYYSIMWNCQHKQFLDPIKPSAALQEIRYKEAISHSLSVRRECQHTANLIDSQNRGYEINKKTTYDWICPVWQQDDRKIPDLKHNFTEWMEYLYPDLEVIEYPENVYYVSPQELKNAGFFEYFKLLWKRKTTKKCNIIWNCVNFSKNEFEEKLKLCKTKKKYTKNGENN